METKPIGKLAILLGKDGREIKRPSQVDAIISWNHKDGVAYAFGKDGKLIAELHNARIEYIENRNIRISGIELIDIEGNVYLAQMWHYVM
ncbi:hypothetical protein [Sulfuricystis multivorans]|uniref:hypothetical protein n=1 Tax=Sulfuricystis multivorans TaxID=2211108 RepID=UPI000F84111F|nr:hypothetical protein [Sulfuricystis multivorans]